MATDLNQAQIDAYLAKMEHNLALLQALDRNRQARVGKGSKTPSLKKGDQSDLLKKYAGIDWPDADDYIFARDPQTGKLTATRKNFAQRNAEWLYPALIGGGGLAAGSLAGGQGVTLNSLAAGQAPAHGIGYPAAAGGSAAAGTGVTLGSLAAGQAPAQGIGYPAGAAAGSGAGAIDWTKVLTKGGALGLAAAMGSGGSGGTSGGSSVPGGYGNGNYPPELQELLRMSLDRMRAQGPLFDAINAQAMGGLPRGRTGVSLPMGGVPTRPSGSTVPPDAAGRMGGEAMPTTTIDDLIARLRAQFAGGA